MLAVLGGNLASHAAAPFPAQHPLLLHPLSITYTSTGDQLDKSLLEEDPVEQGSPSGGVRVEGMNAFSPSRNTSPVKADDTPGSSPLLRRLVLSTRTSFIR